VKVVDQCPLCSLGAGPGRGLCGAVIEHVALCEHWDVDFVTPGPGGSTTGLDNGRVDLLVASPRSSQAGGLDFSREAVISTWAQIYARGDAKIESVLDLAGKSVGVMSNDEYNRELRAIVRGLGISCQFVEFSGYCEVLRGITKGWVAAGAVDRLHALQDPAAKDVKATPVIFSPLELRFAVPTGTNAHLLDALDYHLKRMKLDPASVYYREINRILGSADSAEVLVKVRWVLLAAFSATLLFGGLTLFLRVQVRRKTAALSRSNRKLKAEIAVRRRAQCALARQKRYLTALNATTLDIIERLELGDILDTMLSRAGGIVGVKHGLVYLEADEEGTLEVRSAIGAFSPLVGSRVKAGEGVGGTVWKENRPVLVEDYSLWEHRLGLPALEGLKGAIGVPLRSGPKVIGVIFLGKFSGAKPFGRQEIEILERFAELVAIAWEKARLYAVLQEELAERQRVEQDRRLLITAIDQSPESIVITDIHGKIEYVNPSFERETGYLREEVLGTVQEHFVAGLSDTSVQEDIVGRLSEGRVWSGRFTGRKKDGAAYEVEATIAPVSHGDGRMRNFVSIRRDVTYEVDLERKLRQAQKMEAIGTLAGGIAHDFNNILSPILGYVELTKMRLGQGNGDLAGYMANIEAAVGRARDLVKQILTFSRQSEDARRPLSPQSILRETIKLLRASLPVTIEIVCEIAEDCGRIHANPTQMHQVIMNLCTNAYHAMREDGGILRVSLEEVEMDSLFQWTEPLPPGRYIRISVQDNGNGIPEEVKERIFEPYFTTKSPGEGTGLGLALVHGIVVDHGGTVTVESEPGWGSRFNVFFPRLDSVGGPFDVPMHAPLARGSERVLLVDDEEKIVTVTAEILENLGYRVTACTDGAEALALFRSDPFAFDLVITDHTMPRLTGVQLAREMGAVRPGVPIVLCTGYTESIGAEGVQELGIRAFMLKPIGIHDLAKTLRAVLEKDRVEAC